MLEEPIGVPGEVETFDAAAGKDKFRIVAIGDSITEVGNMERPQRWTGILEAELGSRASVVNAGIGGTSSSLGVYRWKRDVAPIKPHCVVVCFLLNDSNIRHYECATSYLIQCATDRTDANMRIMVERSREMGAEMVIWTPPPVPRWPESFDNPVRVDIQDQLLLHHLWALERLAAGLKVPLVNFWRTFPTLVEEYPGPYFNPPDGYHTTAAAQPVLAEGIAHAVRPIYRAWEKTQPSAAGQG